MKAHGMGLDAPFWKLSFRYKRKTDNGSIVDAVFRSGAVADTKEEAVKLGMEHAAEEGIKNPQLISAFKE